MDGMKIYAHRGASGIVPENTLPAFQHALELGAAGIETDIYCTADGVPVLTHDASLLRTAGRPDDVRHLTWAGLHAVAPQVPRLIDLLDLVGDHVHLDLEIKQAGIEETVLALLAANPHVRWAASCFEWSVLRALRRLDPAADLWLLSMAETTALYATAAELGASSVALFAPAIGPGTIAAAHERGLTVMAWTVNDRHDGAELAAHGLDALCTDHPEYWLNTARPGPAATRSA